MINDSIVFYPVVLGGYHAFLAAMPEKLLRQCTEIAAEMQGWLGMVPPRHKLVVFVALGIHAATQDYMKPGGSKDFWLNAEQRIIEHCRAYQRCFNISISFLHQKLGSPSDKITHWDIVDVVESALSDTEKAAGGTESAGDLLFAALTRRLEEKLAANLMRSAAKTGRITRANR